MIELLDRPSSAAKATAAVLVIDRFDLWSAPVEFAVLPTWGGESDEAA